MSSENDPKWMRPVLIAMLVGTFLCFAAVQVFLLLKIASRFGMSPTQTAGLIALGLALLGLTFVVFTRWRTLGN